MPAQMTPDYADDEVYEVKFVRPLEFRRSKFLPLPTHEMSGRTLKAIIEQEGADVVDSAEQQ